MSTATVSRALPGTPGCRRDPDPGHGTARRLGFTCPPRCGGAGQRQDRTVAVVVPWVTRWFFAAVVEGAEEVLRERGCDLLLYNLGGDEAAPGTASSRPAC